MCALVLYTHALHSAPSVHASPGFFASESIAHVNGKRHRRASPGFLCNVRPLKNSEHVFVECGAGRGRGGTATSELGGGG